MKKVLVIMMTFLALALCLGPPAFASSAQSVVMTVPLAHVAYVNSSPAAPSGAWTVQSIPQPYLGKMNPTVALGVLQPVDRGYAVISDRFYYVGNTIEISPTATTFDKILVICAQKFPLEVDGAQAYGLTVAVYEKYEYANNGRPHIPDIDQFADNQAIGMQGEFNPKPIFKIRV